MARRFAMNCDGYSRVWQLSPDELVHLDGARGTRLLVTRGTLWVTLEHDLRDVVLTPGDDFTIDRGGLTLIQAQADSTVCVGGGVVDEVSIVATLTRVAATLRRWLAGIAEAGSQRNSVPYY